jgi:hypothetical protein
MSIDNLEDIDENLLLTNLPDIRLDPSITTSSLTSVELPHGTAMTPAETLPIAISNQVKVEDGLVVLDDDKGLLFKIIKKIYRFLFVYFICLKNRYILD